MHWPLLDVALCVSSVWAAIQTTVRIIGKRTTRGLSPSLMMLTCFATSSWVFNGLERGQGAQVLSNIVAALAWGFALIAGVVFDKIDLRRVALATVGCVALTVEMEHLGGIAAVGMLATSWSVIGKVPQAFEVWARPGGIAVSLWAFGIGTIQSIAWTAYGLLHHDAWIVTTASYATANAAFVFIRTAQGRRRAPVSDLPVRSVGQLRPAS